MNNIALASAKPGLLVVDDEIEIGEIVRFVAEEGGFEVTLLADPLGFSSVYQRGFRYIVLDLSMPGADGVELLRFLAQDRCDARIVLMSGFDTQVLRAARELAASYGLNVVGTLQKPLDLDALAALLSNPAQQQPAQRTGGAEANFGEEELRRAIGAGEIVPYFMPKVRLSDRAFIGVEALARWQHPAKGLVPPAQFVAVAESCGLIVELTSTIVTQSLAQCGAWQQQGMSLEVAVNVSARALSSVDFPDVLAEQASVFRVKPEQIIVEVTESAVGEDLAQALDILTRLRMKGFGLSIDDFGTGYSSMQQLNRIPFTEIKIDQSFVRTMMDDAQARSIVENTIDLGRRLGMTLVAEGLEDGRLWQVLSQSGCDQAQGYYIGKPMRAAEIGAWRERWNRTAVAGAVQ